MHRRRLDPLQHLMSPVPLRQALDRDRRHLSQRRHRLAQAEVDALADRWRERTGGNGELLDLVGPVGEPRGVVSPRWLCHLFGLRHRSVHILLRRIGPGGDVAILLQVRSATKESYPGHVDTSVGGHVPAGMSPVEAALAEMTQELGLEAAHLDGGLDWITDFESFNAFPDRGWFDREWVDLYTATLLPAALEAVRFPDGEVAGLRLSSPAAALAILHNGRPPVAAGLDHALHHALARL